MVSSRLVNPPDGDPALLLDLPNQPLSYLLDCGDLHRLPLRDLLRIQRVFVTHAHIDHFFGFDHLVRMQLFCEHTLHVYGPPGMGGYVRGKLAGYAWNLVSDSRYAVEVHELHADRVVSQLLPCPASFEPEEPRQSFEVVLAEGPRLDWTFLDHGVDCLAYALRWPPRRKIDKDALRELGRPPGAWLEELKNGTLDDPELRERLLREEPGFALAYASDTLMSEEVRSKLLTLCQGVDEFWCEAAYLHCDLEKASEHHHMTARQVAEVALAAGVKRLYPFHLSRRYHGDHSAHIEEARSVFPGTAPPPTYACEA